MIALLHAVAVFSRDRLACWPVQVLLADEVYQARLRRPPAFIFTDY